MSCLINIKKYGVTFNSSIRFTKHKSEFFLVLPSKRRWARHIEKYISSRPIDAQYARFAQVP
jgi:hypothetical protein